VFIDDSQGKRVLSFGQRSARGDDRAALAQAGGLIAKSATACLRNAGVVPWNLFASWVREVVGERREIVVAMDWTDFDADNQSHARAAPRHPPGKGHAPPKDELKNQRACRKPPYAPWCLSALRGGGRLA
jgi:hypothetical protein